MGILIGLEHVGHEWPGKHVLSDQTLGINEGERIGIVGKNGDGKSTLLDIVAKRLEPDEGSVTWRGGIHPGTPTAASAAQSWSTASAPSARPSTASSAARSWSTASASAVCTR